MRATMILYQAREAGRRLMIVCLPFVLASFGGLQAQAPVFLASGSDKGYLPVSLAWTTSDSYGVGKTGLARVRVRFTAALKDATLEIRSDPMLGAKNQRTPPLPRDYKAGEIVDLSVSLTPLRPGTFTIALVIRGQTSRGSVGQSYPVTVQAGTLDARNRVQKARSRAYEKTALDGKGERYDVRRAAVEQ